MDKVKLGINWADNILPEGFPANTSTLVSGPGGSGKPLIGYMFASGWLKNDGKVVFILTSTTLDYLKSTMKILGTNIDDYTGKMFFIELDPAIDGIEEEGEYHIKANFIKPEIWDEAISLANNYLDGIESELGTMVSGAALNLLFFSKTYGKEIYAKIKGILREDKDRTYFFTVNSDAFRDMVEDIEKNVDNLMFSRRGEGMKLYLKITKMKDTSFIEKEIEVPLSRDILEGIKIEAEKGKKNLIPAIRKI
ncbi:MAG: hypothetical protein J7L93_01240 [Thermoplasmata archaeon]|nr:hypothetical protein [Thermoplasmata archaeon]